MFVFDTMSQFLTPASKEANCQTEPEDGACAVRGRTWALPSVASCGLKSVMMKVARCDARWPVINAHSECVVRSHCRGGWTERGPILERLGRGRSIPDTGLAEHTTF